MPFFHGIKVNEPITGTRALKSVATAVIGIVATATDADAAFFPLNRPVLVTDVRQAIGKAGIVGTLAKVLASIADQCSPIIIVVRVAAGVGATAAADTEANVIGSVAGAQFTGMQALLAAEQQLGVRPRILACPGFETQLVATSLAIVAERLRAFAYVTPVGGNVADVVTYRANFAAREMMLIFPNFTQTSGSYAGDAVARACGLRAKIDETTGWHKSLSNVAVDGVTGTNIDIGWDLLDSSNDAGVLNAADITTLIRSNGFRFWGNRTCSDDTKFAFEVSVRTSQVLQDTIAYGLMPFVDQPISKGMIRDVEETNNAEFRTLKAQGRIIGGEAWYDTNPDINSPANLAAGKITFDYDYTPCAPAEGITLNQRITDRFYANLNG